MRLFDRLKMREYVFICLLLIRSCAFSQIENAPCPRNQPVIAYHQKEKALFLFGGYCSEDKMRLNDLWKFEDRVWVPVTSEIAPPARSGHAMIYDATLNRLIVFGGKNEAGVLLNDLWAWNGEKWEEFQTQGENPAPRQSHRITFNSKTGGIFLFGGSDHEGNALNDAWIFKEGHWTQLNSERQPPPRLQHTLSYDMTRDVVVLFGGFNRNKEEKQVFGDTWEWHPKNGWIWKAEDKELARDHHAMSYDFNHKRTILFGGYHQGYLGDTWSWDGDRWMKLNVDDTLARAGKPGLVYDSAKESMVLFGGWDHRNRPLMDLWRFDDRLQRWMEN